MRITRRLTCTCLAALGLMFERSTAQSGLSILDLQAYREVTTEPIEMRNRRGVVTLTQINPQVNAWFVLTLQWNDPLARFTYHLENADPARQQVTLAPTAGGLRIRANGRAVECALWRGADATALQSAQQSGLPYAPLCDGRLYLRNRVAGTYTRLERITDFLRDHVWGGDKIVVFVKKEFFKDAFIEKSVPAAGSQRALNDRAPSAARLAASASGQSIEPTSLSIDLGPSTSSLLLGEWYAVNRAPGIFVSAIQPEALAPEILSSYRKCVNALDQVESKAVDYLVAFDLELFDLKFALGTDHPRLGWSGRAPLSASDARLPGPDGIDSAAPLVRNGMVSPALVPRTVASFTGGFKREHGAFRRGVLANQNRGSHYGFIEQGAVFSVLQPGLATVYVLSDQSVDIKTWTLEDNALLPRMAFARQNGVPLIELDAAKDQSAPGALVNRWGEGNWSGSADEALRTLRAGLCLQTVSGRRFLIYGYFSTATPSAMARVFQAYQCRYAMHLDMNALEHTYLAIYTHDQGRLLLQHLIEGMSQVDRKGGGQSAPRFLSYPDDRDFFYVVKRE